MIREKKPPGRPRKVTLEPPIDLSIDGDIRERAVRGTEKLLALLRMHHPERDPCRELP